MKPCSTCYFRKTETMNSLASSRLPSFHVVPFLLPEKTILMSLPPSIFSSWQGEMLVLVMANHTIVSEHCKVIRPSAFSLYLNIVHLRVRYLPLESCNRAPEIENKLTAVPALRSIQELLISFSFENQFHLSVPVPLNNKVAATIPELFKISTFTREMFISLQLSTISSSLNSPSVRSPFLPHDKRILLATLVPCIIL